MTIAERRLRVVLRNSAALGRFGVNFSTTEVRIERRRSRPVGEGRRGMSSIWRQVNLIR